MDLGAVGSAICDCESSGHRARAQRLAPTRGELEVQLSERLMARCHAERKGTRGDSVGTRADGVAKGTTGAGRADEWLEADQSCPDLAQRGVVRENGTRPLQSDRRSGLVCHDDCEREGCTRVEAENRW